MPAHLHDLTNRARGYVEADRPPTRVGLCLDWKHFTAWCRRQNLSALPPDPQVVGLYITACAPVVPFARWTRDGKPNSVSTIERRLAPSGELIAAW